MKSDVQTPETPYRCRCMFHNHYFYSDNPHSEICEYTFGHLLNSTTMSNEQIYDAINDLLACGMRLLPDIQTVKELEGIEPHEGDIVGCEEISDLFEYRDGKWRKSNEMILDIYWDHLDKFKDAMQIPEEVEEEWYADIEKEKAKIVSRI